MKAKEKSSEKWLVLFDDYGHRAIISSATFGPPFGKQVHGWVVSEGKEHLLVYVREDLPEWRWERLYNMAAIRKWKWFRNMDAIRKRRKEIGAKMVKKTKEDAIDTGANMVDMEPLMKRCEELQNQIRALEDEMMVMRTSLTVGRATVKWFKGQAFDHDHYSLMIKYKTSGGYERNMTLIRGRELDEVTRQIGELSDDLQGLFEMITNEILDE